MALLKGELFPAGTPLGGAHPHVSLICSAQWQSSRGADGGHARTPSSAFWGLAGSWAHSEPLLVIGGTAAALVCVSALRRDPVKSMLGWCVLSLWLFLGRGGVVLPFYLVPLLAAARPVPGARPPRRDRGRGPPAWPRSPQRATFPLGAAAVAACAALLIVAYARSDRGLWTKDPVAGQLQAVDWIQHHVPPSSRMVIDEYMWEELHDPPPGDPRYADAQYYWKAADDPAVRRQGFNDNWRNVDYVVTTPQLVYDTVQNDFPIVTPALEHSLPVAAFNTGGWQVEVRRVDPRAPVAAPAAHKPPPVHPACMNYT